MGATLLLLATLMLPGTTPPILPPEMQTALLAKVVAYDRAFAQAPLSRLRVLVAQADGAEREAEGVAAALRRAGFPVTVVSADLAAALPGTPAVVYIVGDGIGAALADACARARVLTATARVDLVERGRVTLALALKADS